jgi:hypothetical protein
MAKKVQEPSPPAQKAAIIAVVAVADRQEASSECHYTNSGEHLHRRQLFDDKQQSFTQQ